MYTYFYVYKTLRLFMSAKLYWRIKKNGKWTWQAAIYDLHLSEELMTEHVHPNAELVTLWWPEEEE
jgi:hypothetical protein